MLSAGVLLLVEDDPDHAFLVQRRLREQLNANLEVLHLGTMTAAIAHLAHHDVRCVVLDLSLPDASGLDAVRAIRTAAPSVPVVVLTGMDSDELGREALRLGAQDYLVKGQHGPDAVSRSVVFATERAQRQAAEHRQAQLADRLQLVLEASAEGVCILDGTGALTYVNRSGAELLGATADQLLGLELHDFHECAAACELGEQLLSGRQVDAGEQPFLSLDGSRRVLEVRSRALPETVPAVVVNLADVTERRTAQDALAEREAQLVDAQRLAHLGSWEWDLATDEVVWSDEMYAVTGLARSAVAAGGHVTSYLSLVPMSARAEVRTLFEGWTAQRPAIVLGHPLIRPDGSKRWVQSRVSIAETRVLGTLQDITDQKEAEDALAHQALHDTLTGLPNRALLLDRLERALGYRNGRAVAVAFMDLDRFKWVNDSLSHAAGDELLVAVAARLSAVLRPSDTLARLGGDEFVLLCEQLTNEGQVLDVVARLFEALEQPFTLEGREVVVTASVGLAMAEADDEADPESLLRDADAAMYRAKEKGRSRYEIFDEQMRQRASDRLTLEHDLRAALAADQVHAWYQPVIDLRTGKVVGCEALARWVHPVHGVLLPDAFIRHAEETGQIVTLGSSVLRQACLQIAAWNRTRHPSQALTVSVNVSGRQLADSDLVQTVSDALAESGLDHGQLCLEVTESVVMEDVVASGAVLKRLRDIGVRTAVDDFGTGYSSLAYLLSLPVDIVKVDRSFIKALDTTDGPGVAIVRAVAVLADALGLGVIAEGVETVEQLARLEALGVQQGQGYLWGKAVPACEAGWAETVVPSARTSSDPMLATDLIG